MRKNTSVVKPQLDTMQEQSCKKELKRNIMQSECMSLPLQTTALYVVKETFCRVHLLMSLPLQTTALYVLVCFTWACVCKYSVCLNCFKYQVEHSQVIRTSQYRWVRVSCLSSTSSRPTRCWTRKLDTVRDWALLPEFSSCMWVAIIRMEELHCMEKGFKGSVPQLFRFLWFLCKARYTLRNSSGIVFAFEQCLMFGSNWRVKGSEPGLTEMMHSVTSVEWSDFLNHFTTNSMEFIVSLRPSFLPGRGSGVLLSSYLEGVLYKFHR